MKKNIKTSLVTIILIIGVVTFIVLAIFKFKKNYDLKHPDIYTFEILFGKENMQFKKHFVQTYMEPDGKIVMSFYFTHKIANKSLTKELQSFKLTDFILFPNDDLVVEDYEIIESNLKEKLYIIYVSAKTKKTSGTINFESILVNGDKFNVGQWDIEIHKNADNLFEIGFVEEYIEYPRGEEYVEYPRKEFFNIKNISGSSLDIEKIDFGISSKFIKGLYYSSEKGVKKIDQSQKINIEINFDNFEGENYYEIFCFTPKIYYSTNGAKGKYILKTPEWLFLEK